MRRSIAKNDRLARYAGSKILLVRSRISGIADLFPFQLWIPCKPPSFPRNKAGSDCSNRQQTHAGYCARNPNYLCAHARVPSGHPGFHALVSMGGAPVLLGPQHYRRRRRLNPTTLNGFQYFARLAIGFSYPSPSLGLGDETVGFASIAADLPCFVSNGCDAATPWEVADGEWHSFSIASVLSTPLNSLGSSSLCLFALEMVVLSSYVSFHCHYLLDA